MHRGACSEQRCERGAHAWAAWRRSRTARSGAACRRPGRGQRPCGAAGRRAMRSRVRARRPARARRPRGLAARRRAFGLRPCRRAAADGPAARTCRRPCAQRCRSACARALSGRCSEHRARVAGPAQRAAPGQHPSLCRRLPSAAPAGGTPLHAGRPGYKQRAAVPRPSDGAFPPQAALSCWLAAWASPAYGRGRAPGPQQARVPRWQHPRFQDGPHVGPAAPRAGRSRTCWLMRPWMVLTGVRPPGALSPLAFICLSISSMVNPRLPATLSTCARAPGAAQRPLPARHHAGPAGRGARATWGPHVVMRLARTKFDRARRRVCEPGRPWGAACRVHAARAGHPWPRQASLTDPSPAPMRLLAVMAGHGAARTSNMLPLTVPARHCFSCSWSR